MSMPYRNSNGEMIRISWNTDSLIRLDNVKYDYDDFSIADKDNKKITKGMDKLFVLKKGNFDLLMDNSLYPAYYLISYDNKKVYSDPVDLIKFGDANIDEDTLLVVVDTHKTTHVDAPELLDKVQNIVVVDHHRRSTDYIENATLMFQEVYASSAAELVTELIQYATAEIELKTI